MKKVLLTGLLAVGLVLGSCGNDDDDNAPVADCFTCTDQTLGQTTEYCYTEGDDFYTTSIAGLTPQQTVFVANETWEDVKEAFQSSPNCQ